MAHSAARFVKWPNNAEKTEYVEAGEWTGEGGEGGLMLVGGGEEGGGGGWELCGLARCVGGGKWVR